MLYKNGNTGTVLNNIKLLIIFLLLTVGCLNDTDSKNTPEAEIITHVSTTTDVRNVDRVEPVTLIPEPTLEMIPSQPQSDTERTSSGASTASDVIEVKTTVPLENASGSKESNTKPEYVATNNSENRFHDFFGCHGTGPVEFEHSPMNYDDFISIRPYGHLSGAHVTPIDHMYFNPMDRSLGRNAYEVRAIADGVIYYISPRDTSVDSGKSKEREWRIDIAHTCTFHSYFDLLTDLDSKIVEEWELSRGETNLGWNGISVKSGQVIGRIGAQTLDFGVYDYDTVLSGFVVPEHYNYERWKLHTVDPFPFFKEDIRKVLLSKNLRKVEPYAGKIDHDIDGTLSGNWFELGTNFLAGLTRDKYWAGHVSIIPNHIDPSAWMVAMGSWPEADTSSGADHFIIVNPEILPDEVTKEHGIVKYTLSEYTYCSVYDQSDCTKAISSIVPDKPLMATHTRSGEVGIVLMELIENRKLRLEVFLRGKVDEIHEFTSAVKEYER